MIKSKDGMLNTLNETFLYVYMRASVYMYYILEDITKI